MVFAESLVITQLVPLVTLGGSKDRKIIIGAESLRTIHVKESLRLLKFYGKMHSLGFIKYRISGIRSTGAGAPP